MTRLLRLDVYPQASTERLRIAVTKMFNLALFGLNTPEIDLTTLKFPTTNIYADFSFSETEEWNSTFVHREFKLWTLTNAFRDVAEAINAMLEDIYAVVLPVRLAEQVSHNGLVTESVWLGKRGELVAKPQKFHRGGLLDKFKDLEKLSFSLDPLVKSHALSINNARNCLTHRGGIVGDLDVNAEGVLNVNMYKTFLVARVNGQDVRITLPYHTGDNDTQLGFSEEAIVKSFKLGEKLDFDAEEFSDICWTLWKMADHLDGQVTEYCRKHGGAYVNIEIKPPSPITFEVNTSPGQDENSP